MGWPVKPLGELCEFRNGLWKGKKPPFQEVTVIRNTNFTKGCELDLQDVAVLDVELKQYQSRKLEFGDLILEKSGGGPNQPVGRIVKFEVPDGDYSFSNFTSIVRVKDPSILDYSFLHKFLFYLYEIGATEPLQRQSTGIRNLQLKEYKEIMIPIPALEEQKRIVAMLDEAFAAIEKARELTEQNLKNAGELFESYLHQVFTRGSNSWAEANLGEICEVSSGGTPKKSVSAYWQGDIPWYSSGELNHIYTSDSKEKTTEIGIRESNAKIFPSGSLLIGMYDTAALKMSILDRDGAFNQAIAGVKPNDKVNLEFILYSIEIIKPQLLSLRRGVRQKNLNQSKVREIPLRIPDLQVQDEVVRKITSFRKEVDELLKKYRDKLDLLEILRQSLLDKLLNTD